jgi:hypothetical protein
MQRAALPGLGAWLATAGAASAADPVEVLPEAMYATGKGCAVIKKMLPEDVDKWDFAAVYNTDLYGPEFVCQFTDAKLAKTASGRSWTVMAECEHGAKTKPTTIAIIEAAKASFRSRWPMRKASKTILAHSITAARF